MPARCPRTRRLQLRTWVEQDRESFAAMNADPLVMRYFPEPLTQVHSDALVDRIGDQFDIHGFGLWAIQSRESGEFLGFTGLSPMADGTPGAGGWEIGWRLRRSAWHQGLATEAAVAVRDLALSDRPEGLGLPELWSWTARLNTPSIAVMERIGMRRHGVVHHPRLPPDSPLRPHVVYHLAAAHHGETR